MPEMKFVYNDRTHSASPQNLEDQVALDLAEFLDRFPNKTFAIRILAKESGLNPKTIKRLLAKQNTPTYQTLYKLYSIFLEEDNYEALLEKCPKIISKRIKDYNPCDEGNDRSEESEELLSLLKKEPLLAELYVLAAATPLNKNAVAFRYGEYGLEVLHNLLVRNLIHEVEKDTFTISNSSPVLDGRCLKYLGEYFIRRFAKAENSQLQNNNMINFYAEGLNEAGKHAWLEVDTKAFYQKIEIAKDPKYQGNIPVFTFTATDTITPEKKND